MRRLCLLIFATLAIIGSLLVFPSGIPCLATAWSSVFGIQLLRRQKSWPVAAGLVAILVIKNPAWSWSLGLLIVVLLASICFHTYRIAVVTCLLLANIVFVVDCRVAVSGPAFAGNGGQGIACLGDSLTDYGYPDWLRQQTGARILDYGRDGITSLDGVALIDEILDQRPAVLILELGGHDYNQGRSRQPTWKNLSTIIERCQDQSVMVIIVEVPRGFVRDPFWGIERDLARQYDLHLIPDTLIRQFILFSPICPPGMYLDASRHLSQDGLHPNEKGNQLFASTVARKLRTAGMRIR